MMDAKLRADRVLAALRRITDDNVKGAHDAQMVIVNGIAYIVYEANDIRPGEGLWPYIYCAMSVVDVQKNEVRCVKKIAEPAQQFQNAALKPGTCFVPRILQKDEHTLRVFFWSIDKENRETETWYRDYDLVQEEFSDCIYPVWMETEEGRVPLSPTPFHRGAQKVGFKRELTQDGPYLFDIDKIFDGKRYAALNLYAGKLNALAEINETLDCVRVLSYIFEPANEKLSEAAIEKIPDGKWLAVLRNDANNKNYRFATSEDGMIWTSAEEWPSVQNGSNSKPLLHHYGNVYCLGWQEQPLRTHFNIDVSTDCKSWIRMFSFDNAEFSLQYPSLYLYEDMVYICGTHGTMGGGNDQRDSIYFGRLCSLHEMEAVAFGNIPPYHSHHAE